ncbi:MAG: hypothetical protein RJB65_1223, partial [Actinomycetota bacterium]
MNVPPLMVAIATMGLVGGALVAFGAGLSGRTRPVRLGTRRVGPGAIAGQSSRSFIVASVVALLVLLVSRWPVLAIVSWVGVVMWGPLMSDREAEEERARVEGISKWLDDLRDTLRGSSMGLEEALEYSAS